QRVVTLPAVPLLDLNTLAQVVTRAVGREVAAERSIGKGRLYLSRRQGWTVGELLTAVCTVCQLNVRRVGELRLLVGGGVHPNSDPFLFDGLDDLRWLAYRLGGWLRPEHLAEAALSLPLQGWLVSKQGRVGDLSAEGRAEVSALVASLPRPIKGRYYRLQMEHREGEIKVRFLLRFRLQVARYAPEERAGERVFVIRRLWIVRADALDAELQAGEISSVTSGEG
ncbi:MAG: hypothetical protein NZT92_17455, partial [Abditibacteriales bacterium]|nr:hypothetical protein [Abditibacteriales bacterium]MDW8367636.1 hypothetical protein [Abditibacteriales bacterium]